MAILLHTINQAALVKSTDNPGDSCNMRVNRAILVVPVIPFSFALLEIDGFAAHNLPQL
jgi:hypothetical protein